jgi:hypothetical protein
VPAVGQASRQRWTSVAVTVRGAGAGRDLGGQIVGRAAIGDRDGRARGRLQGPPRAGDREVTRPGRRLLGGHRIAPRPGAGEGGAVERQAAGGDLIGDRADALEGTTRRGLDGDLRAEDAAQPAQAARPDTAGERDLDVGALIGRDRGAGRRGQAVGQTLLDGGDQRRRRIGDAGRGVGRRVDRDERGRVGRLGGGLDRGRSLGGLVEGGRLDAVVGGAGDERGAGEGEGQGPDSA